MGRALRCPGAGCRRAFVATEIPSAPPIVPGTDMYYCAWGFYPMGFPKEADVSTNWKPFCPMYPWNSASPQQAPVGDGNVNKQNVEDNGGNIHVNSTPSNTQQADKSAGSGAGVGPSRGRIKKTTARKKVGGGSKKNASGGVESGIEPSLLGPESWNGLADGGSTVGARGININEVATAPDGSSMMHFGADEEIGFDLDVDATDAILGNLQHLPFLRDDDNARRHSKEVVYGNLVQGIPA
uniref:Uncharacterized protein n=1 Tax=Oryza brachyantha TaxID=4533 RepID=J3MN19_ORYBR